jgi:hypothetical protein
MTLASACGQTVKNGNADDDWCMPMALGSRYRACVHLATPGCNSIRREQPVHLSWIGGAHMAEVH